MKDSVWDLSIFFVSYLYMTEEETTTPTQEEETTTSTEEEKEEKEEKPTKEITTTGMVILILIGLWTLFGFVAFVKSILCFGSSSTMTEKLLGFLLAVFFGPFYFIYLYANKNYCVSSSPNRNTNRNYRRNNNNNNRNTNNNRNNNRNNAKKN
jgi:hypothetical protein